jgi:hypothetical protein
MLCRDMATNRLRIRHTWKFARVAPWTLIRVCEHCGINDIRTCDFEHGGW